MKLASVMAYCSVKGFVSSNTIRCWVECGELNWNKRVEGTLTT
jgi:hypothetical protein